MPLPDNPDPVIRDPRTFAKVNRRELLKVAPLLVAGALVMPRVRNSLLSHGLSFTDWASAKWFRQGHKVPVLSDAELTPLERFPLNTYDADDPEVDLDAWRLQVDGMVQRPGEYRLSDLQALPKVSQNTRHICVEGWDVVGNFAGVKISDFLKFVGTDASARFLYVECADDYYESLDMATALHPQSLLCYEMYGKPLERTRGAPLRLSLPTKIGYKSAKYLTGIKVTSVLERRGYWEDQGYDCFYGL
ncbi:MAG: molybdopterin-dependent oxidoreductase [Acidobacteriales bacterium]|nr:molybdopterin-dependent oxidoreductase [Terriglobales bacterium]